MSSVLLYFTYAVCGIALIANLASIYFINHIWAYRKHKFIQSRSPTLTYSVLWIFFSLLLLAIANTLIYHFLPFWEPKFFFIVNDFIQYGCTFAYATRAWILFYHVEWSYESVNHVWRTQLGDTKTMSEEALRSASLHLDSVDKDEFNDKSLFWIDYRDTLGNWKLVFPITMCLLFPLFIFCLDILPIIIFDTTDSNINPRLYVRIANMLCYLIIFALIYICIRRIGNISDKYGIGQELRRINICFAVLILLGRIIDQILRITLGNRYISADVTIFIAGMCTILSTLLSLYIGSFFVLRRLFRVNAGMATIKDLTLGNDRLKSIVTMFELNELKKNKSEKDIGNVSEQKITVNRVLSTQYGFETFTQFLISEFSVENILFLVEVKQYKACCRKYHKAEKTPLPVSQESNSVGYAAIVSKKKNSTETAKFDPKMVLSLKPTTTTRSKPNVFNSHSVMNVDYVPSNRMLQLLDPYDYAMYLYHKYVIDGSDLQINIPSKTRKNLTKFLIKTPKTDIILLDDYTDQMFKLYDRAWEQIHSLINSDSYHRFQNTIEYTDLCARMKEEFEKEKEEFEKKFSESTNGNDSDFLSHQKPSILDWEFTEINTNRTKIPEEEEVDDDDLEAQMRALDSIHGYDAIKDKVTLSDDVALVVLEDIPSYNEANEGESQALL